jgi:hypothetical protein
MVFVSSSLGGGFNGISPTVTINTQQGNSNVAPFSDASQVTRDRMYLRKAFPTNKFRGQYILTTAWPQTPFRVAMNAGDLLLRQAAPGGSNQIKGSVGVGKYRNTMGLVDGVKTGDGASGNQHYVYDSSVYVRYKGRVAKNKNYNDVSFVGDKNNGSFTAIKAIRRF